MGNVMSRLKARTKRGRRPNVLILCQRNADTRTRRDRASENVDAVVSNLENYVKRLWPGLRPRVEYLSDIKGEEGIGYPTGVVDYNIDLFPGKPGVDRFMQRRRGYYDLVVMNSCPVAFMHYGIIAQLLKPKGYLSVQAFTTLQDGDVKLNGTLTRDPANPYLSQVPKLTEPYFTQIKTPTDEFFFRKRTVSSKKRSTL